MSTMIALEGIEKVYRTDRIETVALSGGVFQHSYLV